MITAADIEGAACFDDAHYNMGFDEHGRQKGYGYGYSFTNFPRLRFIDRLYKTEGNRQTRTWYVDGAECADLLAAIDALNKPAVLTEDERAALERIPTEFVCLRRMECHLAGCEHPEGAIEPGTPHAIASDLIHRLRAKGAVELGKLPEHLRWSPTIRRVVP